MCGCVHVLKSTCSDLCGLGSHAVRELIREMMKRSRANFKHLVTELSGVAMCT